MAPAREFGLPKSNLGHQCRPTENHHDPPTHHQEEYIDCHTHSNKVLICASRRVINET